MKRAVLLVVGCWLMVAGAQSVSAQIITQSINYRAFYRSTRDTIDIGNDGQGDLRIYLYVDPSPSYAKRYFILRGVHAMIEVTAPTDSGSQFSSFFLSEPLVVSPTGLPCDWPGPWIPGGGFRYSGFRRINSPNDTTYGWIKLNFIGEQGTCADTMVSNEIAYNLLPNVPLKAGEGASSPIGIFETINEEVKLSPNPATTFLSIQLSQTPSRSTVFQLFDITGRMILEKPLSETINQIDLNGVSKGMYLYNVVSEKGKAGAGKLIIE